MFEDTRELNKKIRYILNNKNTSKKIRRRGYFLSKKHSYEQRVKSLIKYINRYEKFSNT